MSYCGNCGAQIDGQQNFCAGCGASVSEANAPAQQPMEASTVSVAAQQDSEAALRKPKKLNAQAPPPAERSRKKILTVVLAIFLVGAMAAVAGVVYFGYRVKQNASAALDKLQTGGDGANRKVKSDALAPHNSRNSDSSRDGSSRKNTDQSNPQDGKQQDGDDAKVAKGLDAIGGLMDKMGFGDPPPNPYKELPIVQPDDIHKNFCDPNHEATDLPNSSTPLFGSSGIPMEKGLLVVHAWGRKSGDSESINTVSRITNKYVEIGDSGTYFLNPDAEKGDPDSAVREVCTYDLQSAHGLATGFVKYGPLTLPGTTIINISLELFRALKESGKIDFRYLEYYAADPPEAGGYLHWDRGVLTRVEPGDVSWPVIVNGTPTKLPTIHAAGTVLVESKKAQELSKDPADRPLATDLYVLDDPTNPLVLLFRQNINNFRVQVTEIRFPLPAPEKKIEQELSKNKKALVYGIYFDYNSDEIKKESEPVLKEIAQPMADRPTWKLMITGHTDNIGGHKYNLELSQRRSASVKKALVDRYDVDPNRLSTSGSGDYAPIDTNDTLEGRARNRRVELTLD
jgi:outer membrane protein OmpA-like peptidoglycan-associated protein